MFATLLLVLAVAGVVVVVRSLRGGGTPQHPRCFRCDYDMRDAAALVCPECGHAHADPAELMRARRKPAGVGCGIVMLLVGVGMLALMASRQPWYLLLPRPVLRVAVRQLAPPLSPASPGSLLPSMPSSSPPGGTPWDSLLWGEQAGDVIRAWGKLVVTDQPGLPDAKLDQLMAAADQVEEVYDQTGGMSHVLGWVVDDAKREVVRAWRAAAGNTSAAPRDPTFVKFDPGQRAVAELQYHGDYSHRPDWATVPIDLLLHLLKSDSLARRAWALGRLNRKQPDAERLLPEVRRIIETDPNPSLRNSAAATLYWLRMDHDGRWGRAEDER